jgi:hypothetical protein
MQEEKLKFMVKVAFSSLTFNSFLMLPAENSTPGVCIPNSTELISEI